jgi:hypothetical protein
MDIKPEYLKDLEANVNSNIINWEYVEQHLATTDYRGREFKKLIIKILKEKIK